MKVIYRYSAIPIKTAMSSFVGVEKSSKRSFQIQRATILGERTKSKDSYFLISKLPQSYSK